MNNLANDFANFFREHSKLHPEWALSAPKGRPPGFLESIRVEFLQSQGMYDPLTLRTGRPWSSFVGSVYNGGSDPATRAILAYYKDG
ncbi:MAG: hypothetical protein WAM60_04635, partial [Candidatus Promineifilaceae bacterium]